ncbi:hypothetical protein HJG60_010484 [Phyllostomus discolor]|uniref:Uncharacterized protein n=1 Tax=Phyllostomus discolor TaxID=89673 RepID=A0A834AHE5_9CHIR|nr:hypothetical protein HJG60_010484 [Phyllostomus discolor]
MPPSSYSPAPSPFSKCTEAILHLNISCRDERLHPVIRKLNPSTGLPLKKETEEKERGASAMSPTGRGSHCDRQQFLSPAHFSICHLTADLHDKNTSIFGTPRILVLSESTKGNVRERTFYFNNNYYYK